MEDSEQYQEVTCQDAKELQQEVCGASVVVALAAVVAVVATALFWSCPSSLNHCWNYFPRDWLQADHFLVLESIQEVVAVEAEQ